MRLGRIASPDGVAFVSIEGEVKAGSNDLSDLRAREIAEHPFGTPEFTGRSWPLVDVRLLAPILASKVVCMGKNYAAHAEEMGGVAPEDPVIFLKPNTAIIDQTCRSNCPPTRFRSTTRVSSPPSSAGRARTFRRPGAAENILGYTIANDVSARDQQKKDGSGYGPRATTRSAPGEAPIAEMRSALDQEFDVVLLPVSHPALGAIRITDDLFAIGRSEAPFADYPRELITRLSRRHARIFAEHGAVYVADLDSKNGTAVNGVGVCESPSRVRAGDELCFGGELCYRVGIEPRAFDSASVRVAQQVSVTLMPERTDLGLDPIDLHAFPFLVSKTDELFRAL